MAQQAETVSERFALRVDEIERECVISLASRLAQRNGEVRLRSFCTHLSLPIKQLRLGEEGCLRALSKLADLDLEQLWAGVASKGTGDRSAQPRRHLMRPLQYMR